MAGSTTTALLSLIKIEPWVFFFAKYSIEETNVDGMRIDFCMRKYINPINLVDY
jgi:hypothetical protein